jgi:hypothetical protein
MKRVIHICIVFSVILGSCSHLLAVALCLHMECRSFNKEVGSFHKSTSEPHSQGHSCPSSLKHSEEPHDVGDSSRHKTKEHVLTKDISFNNSSSCAHCIGGSTVPTATVTEQEVNLTRRDAGVEVPYVIRQLTFSLLSHVPEVIPSQGAPPGSSKARYLLINIFRI